MDAADSHTIDPCELREVVVGRRERVGHFDRQRVLLGMLERWYRAEQAKGS
jgi:hypothetical protein